MIKSRTGLVFLTAGITAFITSVLWVGIGAIAYWYMTDEPPPFVVSISSPGAATTGEEINLIIEVSNPTVENLKLGSIDIYDSLIDGFAIMTVDPPPDTRDDSLGFTSLYYSKSLAPGASFTANLTLKAQDPGVWTGDIDCCTPLEKFVTTSHTIVVTDSSSAIRPAEQGVAGEPATAPKSNPE